MISALTSESHHGVSEKSARGLSLPSVASACMPVSAVSLTLRQEMAPARRTARTASTTVSRPTPAHWTTDRLDLGA